MDHAPRHGHFQGVFDLARADSVGFSVGAALVVPEFFGDFPAGGAPPEGWSAGLDSPGGISRVSGGGCALLVPV